MTMTSTPRPITISAKDIFQDDRAFTPGFFSQLGMLLFQPRAFFRAYVPAQRGRRWLWVAMLILAVLAFNAVQRSEQSSAPAGGVDMPPVDMPAGPGGMPFDMPFPPESAAPPANAASPAGTWMTALTAAGSQIVQWFVLALLLAEVTMFNGRAPRLGTNLQIAVWASLPLALMAAVQMLFIAGGGSIGRPGLSGFLESWDTFAGLNIYLRSFVHGLASQFTLFWLWSLILLYIGARQSLRGKRPAVLLVIAMWVVVLGIGSGIQSYRALSAGETPGQQTEFAPDGEFMPEEMLSEDGAEPAITEDAPVPERGIDQP